MTLNQHRKLGIKNINRICVSVVIFLVFFGFACPCFATCAGSFVAPWDIDWSGIFPISIGPPCFCGLFDWGLEFDIWVPDFMQESVKDAWCFPTFGFGLGDIATGDSGGGVKKCGETNDDRCVEDKAQVHHFVNPYLAIFDWLPCWGSPDDYIPYFSEVDPLHQDCQAASTLFPEALLVANPVAQLIMCPVDSAASVIGQPMDSLYWCVGSWGSLYPICGYSSNYVQVEAAALHSAKNIFYLERLGLMLDPGVDSCGPVYTPVWWKSHNKIQEVRPVPGMIVSMGQTSTIWGTAGNPSYMPGQDNFSFVLFRHHKCCI